MVSLASQDGRMRGGSQQLGRRAELPAAAVESGDCVPRPAGWRC